MHKLRGFTIVEIIIVISVIAILAAISLVAYNGIQERARNARLIASIDAFEKVLRIYYAQKGKYPETMDVFNGGGFLEGGHAYACVGKPDDYPARDGFQQGECLKDSAGANHAIYSSIFNNELASVAQGLSVPSTNAVSMSGDYARGVVYYGYSYEGGSVAAMIYPQKGDQSCGRGEKNYTPPGSPGMPQTGMTQCTIVLY